MSKISQLTKALGLNCRYWCVSASGRGRGKTPCSSTSPQSGHVGSRFVQVSQIGGAIIGERPQKLRPPAHDQGSAGMALQRWKGRRLSAASARVGRGRWSARRVLSS